MTTNKMVTRTVISTTATVLVFDTKLGDTSEQVFVVPGKYPNDDNLLKQLKKVYDTEVTKLLHVKSSELIEELRGMSEQDFLVYSKALPPRAKKEEE